MMRERFTVTADLTNDAGGSAMGRQGSYGNRFTFRSMADMQAMILAAGFGTRLLPFTEFRPKPLFPIMNKPLLLLTIERLQRAGFDHIVVNCHHLRQQIIDLLCDIKGIVIQQEEVVLGTGGGLRLALQSLRDEPVLVTNGDIYHTVDYRLLYEAHRIDTAPVTMAMHDFPRFNTVSVQDELVAGFDHAENGRFLAFTGLHVLNPEILSAIPFMQPSSIIDCYRLLLKDKRRIHAVRVDGCFWTDMGTVQDYLALHGGLLTGRIPWWQELGVMPDTPFFLADRQTCSRTVTMTDWVCVGQVEIGDDVSLQRVVVWDGASVPGGSRLEDALIIQ
jgi:NDP-sugar pyrophosphorylase family protein